MDATHEGQPRYACEQEIHTYLDSLTKDKFYGEVTFYFQNGTVEFCRKMSRLSKSEIIAIQRGKDMPAPASCEEV